MLKINDQVGDGNVLLLEINLSINSLPLVCLFCVFFSHYFY